MLQLAPRAPQAPRRQGSRKTRKQMKQRGGAALPGSFDDDIRAVATTLTTLNLLPAVPPLSDDQQKIDVWVQAIENQDALFANAIRELRNDTLKIGDNNDSLFADPTTAIETGFPALQNKITKIKAVLLVGEAPSRINPVRSALRVAQPCRDKIMCIAKEPKDMLSLLLFPDRMRNLFVYSVADAILHSDTPIVKPELQRLQTDQLYGTMMANAWYLTGQALMDSTWIGGEPITTQTQSPSFLPLFWRSFVEDTEKNRSLTADSPALFQNVTMAACAAPCIKSPQKPEELPAYWGRLASRIGIWWRTGQGATPATLWANFSELSPNQKPVDTKTKWGVPPWPDVKIYGTPLGNILQHMDVEQLHFVLHLCATLGVLAK